MKSIFVSILSLTLFGSAIAADVHVWFSPSGGCAAEVVSEVSKAQFTILVQAYNFTSGDVGNALAAAAGHGVKVLLIQDSLASRQKNWQGPKVAMSGGKVFLDHSHAIAHNKVMVIDGKTVLTGSFNFSANAEKRNAENLIRVTGDAALASAYSLNWSNHLSHSVKWKPETKSPKEKLPK